MKKCLLKHIYLFVIIINKYKPLLKKKIEIVRISQKKFSNRTLTLFVSYMYMVLNINFYNSYPFANKKKLQNLNKQINFVNFPSSHSPFI